MNVEITSQNNLYALNKEQLLNSKLVVTHENVIGQNIVGIKDEENQMMAILFEPTKPIDKDGEDISLEFLNLINANRKIAIRTGHNVIFS